MTNQDRSAISPDALERLEAKLREQVPYQGRSAIVFLCHEAADVIEALREALEPFAASYDAATLAYPNPNNYADWLSMMRHSPNSKDFRKASDVIGWKARRAASILGEPKP